MALTRITKGVIKPNENYDTHDINSTGIITAVGANFTGNVSVGGILTYEDVSSIDSVGIITANQGIHVGAGISVVGVGSFGTIKVGTGVTIESNGQAEIAGITTFYKDVHIKSATNRLYVGANDRISLIADPNHSYLRVNGGHFQIHNNNLSLIHI